MIKGIVRASILISIGVLLSRLSGFFRESMLAASLGIGSRADMAVLLFSLPDLLIVLLMGGAFSITFIPEFQRAEKEGNSKSLYYRLSFQVAAISFVISLILTANSSLLAKLMAPGFDLTQIEDVSAYLEIVVWAFPLSALAGVTSAYLHANERFGIVSLGSLIFNLVIVVGLVLAQSFNFRVLFVFSITIVVGSLFRWISQVMVIETRNSKKDKVSFAKLPPLNKKIVLPYLQVLLAAGSLMLIPVIGRAFISEYGIGSVAILNFAYKLVEFPLALIGTVFSIALFPTLSKAVREGRALRGYLIPSVRIAIAITVAASLILVVASKEYTSLIYGWGVLKGRELSDIQSMFRVLIFSLPMQALIAMLSIGLNSIDKSNVVLKYNILTLIFFVILIYFVNKMGGATWIAFAIVIAFLFNVSLHIFNLSRHQQFSFGEIVSLRCAIVLLLFSVLFVYAASFAINIDDISIGLKYFYIIMLGIFCFVACLLLLFFC